MNRIYLLKLIDAYVGRGLCKIISSPHATELHTPESILVIRPGGIGDAVLLLPMLQRVKHVLPRVKLDVLAERRNCEIFTLTTDIDSVWCYDDPIDLLKVIRRGYDVVIDTEQWHHLSAIIARLCCKSALMGFATNDRKKLLNFPINYSSNRYESACFMDLLKPLEDKLDCFLAPSLHRTVLFSFPTDAVARTSELLGEKASSNYIVIFPGASIKEKRWGSENFIDLAKRLGHQGFSIVVLGGRSELEVAKQLERACGALNLAGVTSLLEAAIVIGRAKLVISGDSGLLHLAVIQNVPTVSLFGPSNAAKWAPPGPCHVTVNMKSHCSPCSVFGYTPKCTYKMQCMTAITVDAVLKACAQVISQRKCADQK